MKDVTINGVRYTLSADEIFIGDNVYNPIMGSIDLVDEEDDLYYVNENYYKIKPNGLPRPRPKFFKY